MAPLWINYTPLSRFKMLNLAPIPFKMLGKRFEPGTGKVSSSLTETEAQSSGVRPAAARLTSGARPAAARHPGGGAAPQATAARVRRRGGSPEARVRRRGGSPAARGLRA